MCRFPFSLIIGLVSAIFACSINNANPDAICFNVLDYGAAGDGTTDDSQAFLMAWNEACSSETENPTLIIPRLTFLVSPVVFRGPCKAKNINFLILGMILAPDSPQTWKGLDQSQWLAFHGVSGLNVGGSGWINGQGKGWWDQSCRYHPHMKECTSLAPTAVKFLSCKRSSLSDIHFVNSAQTHVLIMRCDGMEINHLIIQAPETSPNTDGIHIQASYNVVINDIIVSTGDDCISIGDHTSNIYIFNVGCGPGHGISIGSLGRSGNIVQVENIYVSRVYLKGTTNGARIKTWQVGKGHVRGVTFENLYFDSVKNPIIIDQNYCNIRGACKEQKTGVQISDVLFENIYGTSSTDVAINLNCSRSVACTGILMKSIYLTSDKIGHKLTSYCTNAYGYSLGMIQPLPCLQI
ncbi:probable polygalacturonase At1g80170 isoform X1 [Ziziphus jujuba]|uniref:Probable polygalacturonase At1g80170 isoform X1 n=2 Tax=Ziziphus jujuba TaxID=326968 RepID=A0ABM3INA7_ZIZJJ|nr:probable polygalacturonase At1g80170 isoform X1 [Ziziphus jujuba]